MPAWIISYVQADILGAVQYKRKFEFRRLWIVWAFDPILDRPARIFILPGKQPRQCGILIALR
jgi:hypothetical protein